MAVRGIWQAWGLFQSRKHVHRAHRAKPLLCGLLRHVLCAHHNTPEHHNTYFRNPSVTSHLEPHITIRRLCWASTGQGYCKHAVRCIYTSCCASCRGAWRCDLPQMLNPASMLLESQKLLGTPWKLRASQKEKVVQQQPWPITGCKVGMSVCLIQHNLALHCQFLKEGKASFITPSVPHRNGCEAHLLFLIKFNGKSRHWELLTIKSTLCITPA